MKRVSRPLAFAFMLALSATACYQRRLTRNAPGHVSLGAPPADPSRRLQDEPRDPGDQAVIFSGGAFVAGGIASGGGRATREGYGLGLEGRVLYGRFAGTAFGALEAAFPDRAVGAGLGWTPFLEEGQRGRVHLELQTRLRALGLAVGWSREAGGRAQGPQATASVGPVFLRGAYLSHRGTALQAGVALEPTFALVWSR